jgi:hypothetical protein
MIKYLYKLKIFYSHLQRCNNSLPQKTGAEKTLSSNNKTNIDFAAAKYFAKQQHIHSNKM